MNEIAFPRQISGLGRNLALVQIEVCDCCGAGTHYTCSRTQHTTAAIARSRSQVHDHQNRLLGPIARGDCPGLLNCQSKLLPA